MILLSHPLANDTVRHVALALERAGMLGEFWTCSTGRTAPQSLAPAALPERVAPPRRSRSFNAACRTLDRTVSTRLAGRRFTGVYAYEYGAEETFRAAGSRGLLRIYGVSTGHWRAERAICAEEADLEPEWAATLDHAPRAWRAFARRDAELQQADLVVASSSFLLSTLDRVSPLPAAVAVIPPGTPIVPANSYPAPAPPTRSGRLRVLYAGNLGQRHGLSYLFRACSELHRIVELTVIGPPPRHSCPALARELACIRWLDTCAPSVLHAEMAAHDVLLAPAIFSGFDPVLLDALAHGLPVIATPHTAAPDFIDDGVEGFIVPIRSTGAIVAQLEVLQREPDRRLAMSAAARERARQHSWETYERALAASVATALARYEGA
ncbi:MAG: glycosyltransferase family 4 protein [Verrucomicrobiota bacterium]